VGFFCGFRVVHDASPPAVYGAKIESNKPFTAQKPTPTNLQSNIQYIQHLAQGALIAAETFLMLSNA
jgi:hypothetical protein